ncbi:hypothetical protein GW766_03145 [Candidatus Parcubacteria bacterium]|nr:hypothetical protein [Candidatus Parcubacteria bacterium]
MGLFFNKKNEDETVSGVYAPYEQIDSKRTSKLGYFFLLLMVIFGIWQGNMFLAEVQDSVDAPMKNSDCSARLANAIGLSFTKNYYYDRDYYSESKCAFSPRELTLGLDRAYANAVPYFEKINTFEKQLSGLNQQRYTLENSKRQTMDEYQVSLIEEMAARGDTYFNPEELGTGYAGQKENLTQINGQIQRVTAQKEAAVKELSAFVMTYRPLLNKAESEYVFDVKQYQFILFLISVVLVGPLFYFVWRRYHAARLTRSAYTIIWGGAVATFGFILAQVMLVFVYEILPREILEAMFSFLAELEFIWTLLTYFGFILVPLFFGFLIYFIQKKLYNKQAVLMRALKNEHCPNCSFKVTPDMNNCPICGYKIKSQCATCNHMSLDGGTFCSVCGVNRRIETNS